MTRDERLALGQRALEAGFKWAPGCIAVSTREKYDGAVYVCQDYDGEPMFVQPYPGADTIAFKGMAPDFADVGTLAHAMAQIHERTGFSSFALKPMVGGQWEVTTVSWSLSLRELVPGIVGTVGATRGHAVVNALEVTHRGGF